MAKPDVVIDTNVLISAQRSRRGAASRLLSLMGTGLFEVHISVPLILEYEDVLLRQQDELDRFAVAAVDPRTFLRRLGQIP